MEKARKFQKNYFCFIDYVKVFDYVDNNKLWEILKDMGIPDHLTCLLAESKEELKTLLMRVKEESEKVALKLTHTQKQQQHSYHHGIWSHHFMENRKGKSGSSDKILLGGCSKITVDGDHSYEIKVLATWKESYDKPRQHIKKQRHHFADKGLHRPCSGFSSSQAHM